MGKIKSICVFCGSHKGGDPEYLNAAYETGKYLAEKGVELVYGGGNVGLMGMVAKGALETNGKVTGIITKNLMEMEVGHTGLSNMRVTESMHERKFLMNKLSDAFISLPGGIGTLEETFEMFTWFQLGDIAKPIGILNVSGYYSILIKFLNHVVGEGFLREEHFDSLIVESNVEILIDKILKSDINPIGKWFDKAQNFVQ